MNGRVVVGRVKVERGTVDVSVLVPSGNVQAQMPGNAAYVSGDAAEVERIAALMTQAAKVAPEIVAAYETCDRAHQAASATRDRLVQRAIERVKR